MSRPARQTSTDSSNRPARRHSSASCAKAIDAGSFWTRRRRSSIRGLSTIAVYGLIVTDTDVVPLRPTLSMTVRETVRVAALPKTWFATGPFVLVVPSPKFHWYETICAPPNTCVPLASNVTSSPTFGVDGERVNDGTGLPLPTVSVADDVPFWSVSSLTVSTTTYVPDTAYECDVEMA